MLHAWGLQPRQGAGSQEKAPSPTATASQLLFQALGRLQQASPHCFAHISKCHCFLQHLILFFFFFFLFASCLFITKAYIL